jgi:DNA-binding phage protein
MRIEEQAGDREAAGAIAGMLEVYGAPRAEPVSVLEVIRHLIARDCRSWSQIARDAGVSQSQVSRLMHGERDVAVFTMEMLASSLGFCLWLKPVTEGIPLDLLVLDPSELEPE